jgi:colanic acid biosynthesis glycosyl transferase WcaI
VEKESETWNLVKRAQAGLCVPPEHPSDIADAILYLKRDKRLREQLGQNGRAWAEQHHSSYSAAEKMENLLLRASSPKRKEMQTNFQTRQDPPGRMAKGV